MSRVAMIFAGQGSQALGMGEDFYNNSAVAREMFEEASQRVGVDFKELLFTQNEKLAQTAFTQPAILLVQMIAYRLFKEKYSDITPTLFLGHSLGEFSALCASGAIAFGDAIELVHKRGAYMQQACDAIEAGMMVLLGLDDGVVEKLCEDARGEGKKVWAANYNQDGQIVVAGMKSDLVTMEQVFKDAGAKRALLLDMSVASHCPLLESAQAPLTLLMEQFIIENFEAPIISNVTTKPYSSKADALKLLKDQLVMPVKYKQSIEAIMNDVDLFIEFGHGATLKGLNRKIAKDLPTYNLFDIASLEALHSELY